MISSFSAKEPALGYYYQVIRGLVLLLSENYIVKPSLLFEWLDDITIVGTDKIDLYQTKLHINPGQMTDRSPDFWKTIRIWSNRILDQDVNPLTTIFSLITTSSPSENSFISLFNSDNSRDATILSSMEVIAKEKTNDTNLAGYQAFNSLTDQQKKALIHNIRIIDSNVSCEETFRSLERLLQYSAPPSALSSFIDQVLGWWFKTSFEMLISGDKQSISKDTVNQYLQTCRDQIRADALPNDFFKKIDIDDQELNESKSEIYIKQLYFINASVREKKTAISDYKRAYGQRSKWLKDGKVTQEEFDLFDSDLEQGWNSRFNLMLDELDEKWSSGLIERQSAGHSFYRSFYINSEHAMPTFRNNTSLYISKGSYHMLSNTGVVGWHPDYKKLLDNDENME